MKLRRLALAAIALGSALPSLAPPAGAAERTPSLSLTRPYAVHHSSPVIADLDRNGVNEVFFGGIDGYVHVVTAGGGALKGWPKPVIPYGSGKPVAIESSPTVADLDRDGRKEVIVGAGSLVRRNQHGGLVVFGNNGQVRCRVATKDIYNQWTGGPPDGYREAVFSTPAVGDVNGDRYPDIVFGSWDHRIYAVNRFCNPIPGFPIDALDTITSSPALYDIDRDGRQEIFIGSDATPRGGVVWAVDYARGRSRIMWKRHPSEIVQSSPAIGDIDRDGRMEVVVGTGVYYQTASSNRVYAFNAENGTTVRGWPRGAHGNTFGSPAIGDLNRDGKPEVVIATRDGRVQAYRGSGSVLWRVTPRAGTGPFVSSPIIGDLDGDGDHDVAVGNGGHTYFLDGRTGARRAEFGKGWAYYNAPALARFGTKRRLVVLGTDPAMKRTFLAHYPLPQAAKGTPWSQWRDSANHLGR